MEITNISAFLDYYERVRERTLRLISFMPADNIDYAYKPGKFTIADVVRHIAAMERFMFAENVSGRPSRYRGCGTDLADGYDEVIVFFNEMHRQSVELIGQLDEASLNRKCTTPGGAITTWKWLRAMVEHEIHHRGELYIYLNLLDIKTPPMFGLTAEEVGERAVI